LKNIDTWHPRIRTVFPASLSPQCLDVKLYIITCNVISDFRALGFLGFYLSSIGDDVCLAALDLFVQCLHGALMSTSGSQYMVAAMTVTEWASLDKVKFPFMPFISIS
jgi:hypothetical protein